MAPLSNRFGMSDALKFRLNGSKSDIELRPGARSRPTRAKRSAEARRPRTDFRHIGGSDPRPARRGRDAGRYLDLRLDLVADASRRRCCRACRLFESPYFAIARHSYC